jgi:hypothetical protein
MARAVVRYAAMFCRRENAVCLNQCMNQLRLRGVATLPPSLQWKLGRYDAVEIDMRNALASDSDNFKRQLSALVAEWQEAGKAGAWLRCDISQGHLLSAAGECGFEFHNAEGKTAVLHRWLREGKSPVPLYATHHVGVGAIVLDNQSRLLLVREAGKHSHKGELIIRHVALDSASTNGMQHGKYLREGLI